MKEAAGFIQIPPRFTRARLRVSFLSFSSNNISKRHEEGCKQVNVTLVEGGCYVAGAVPDIIRIHVRGTKLRERQGISFSIGTSGDTSFQTIETRNAIRNRRPLQKTIRNLRRRRPRPIFPHFPMTRTIKRRPTESLEGNF